MEQKRYVLSGYAVWIAVLIAIYYRFGSLRITAWALISLSGVAAILAGLLVNRPARKSWFLVAACARQLRPVSLRCQIAARLRMVLPFPSFADVLYPVGYLLAAAGC